MKKLLTIILGAMIIMANLKLNANETNDRKVFAHYMTCYSATPLFYKREMMLAQHYGIDGFALNCGEWLKKVKGKSIETLYPKNADNIFEQAKLLNTGFKLFMSPDFAGRSIANLPLINVTAMLKRYYKHPNLFRYKNKVFFSGYSGTRKQYALPINKLRSEGYKFWCVPKVSLPKYKMAWSMESLTNIFNNDSVIDGVFNFACDSSVQDIIKMNAMGRRNTLFHNKIYMAGVSPAYNSPNLRDFSGISGYCSQWKGLINDGADLVEMVTWNDYGEDSNLNPYRWTWYGNAGEKEYFDRDESYLDVASYFIKYFKNKIPPKITQDRIYFTYRTRSKHKVKAWDKKTKKWIDIRFYPWPYDQIHDDVKDRIYITGFLKDDANLSVTIAGETHNFKLKKGISSCESLLKPGVPQFVLSRKGKELINVYGRKTIIYMETKENSTRGFRLENRTWTSGAVAGKTIIKLDAKDTKVSIGKELKFEIPTIKMATYNFRIKYKNSSKTESRLTLYSNGAPGANGKFPFYFPLFLPPTGKEFRTVSFLWTQWSNTSELKIKFDDVSDKKKIKGWNSDIGSAIIRSIELIKVKPFKTIIRKNNIPEMVKIPAGAFIMGSNNSQADEAPSHKVNLSSFAIGKYEVTNEEYEKINPGHKKDRDGYSWRNNEPVIYVSWQDAARYCNMLSEKYGLETVYNEKTWKANIKANGFRLPTEAEWEYVATGRGENRIYPWGDKKPTSQHGNFAMEKALDINPLLASSFEAGVVLKGSFPKGRSRDGVMDLAGNVAEWCTDYFNLYTKKPQTNPCNQIKSNYRVLRGGSWGYYNLSQRNKDREFNSQKYPGYIYIGFRLAISIEGYEYLKIYTK